MVSLVVLLVCGLTILILSSSERSSTSDLRLTPSISSVPTLAWTSKTCSCWGHVSNGHLTSSAGLAGCVSVFVLLEGMPEVTLGMLVGGAPHMMKPTPQQNTADASEAKLLTRDASNSEQTVNATNAMEESDLHACRS